MGTYRVSKSRRRLALGAGAALFATGATALLGGAVAAAASPPNVTGQKYSDASATLSGAGFTPVVSATVGDQKARPDCLVANQQERTVQPPPNSSGSPKNEVLVSLNCYSAEASAKAPGYSAASPEGKAIATPAPGR
jgi:hypothetical protein